MSNLTIENQNTLEIEWSNYHEIIPKEDEIFSFQHQLLPLDFSNNCYDDFVPLQQDLLDASYFLDIISMNTIYSSMNILSDNPPYYEDGFLVNGELGLTRDQEMPMINRSVKELYPTDQEIPTFDQFPNQEMHMINHPLRFSYENQPRTKNIDNDGKEETNGCQEKKEDTQHKGNNNGDYMNNNSSRLMLSKETISQYFYMPITQAAKELNVGLTLLKKRCRELGIRRWPRRKLMSLTTLINNMQNGLVKRDLENPSENEAKEKIVAAIDALEKERKKLEEVPDIQLGDTTKRLRQACFKANYKKRKTILMGKPSSCTLMANNYGHQSSSSCSSTCVDDHRGRIEAMGDDYGNDQEQEELDQSNLLLTAGFCFPSAASNCLMF
uniref:protein RKD5-like n=1 Tax=Erigeron canadensis TaxID=72917 RepID=UPI001CB9763C|nr:protein RKD5-like [Erigeron canadensis]